MLHCAYATTRKLPLATLCATPAILYDAASKIACAWRSMGIKINIPQVSSSATPVGVVALITVVVVVALMR